MYEKYYGFKEEPFRLSPDSSLCYRHPSYKKALAYMQYALHRSEGFVMVTGQPGTGKTTLIRDLVSDLAGGELAVANLECTQLEAKDLLRTVVFRFGLEGASNEKSHLLNELDVFLRKIHRDGRRALLVIDEAQALPMSAIEELRLLTNLNQDNKPLLQIFIIGQEELRELVHSPKLEQLHQRLVASCHLFPLDAERTESYVKYRLGQVGWTNKPEFEDSIFPYIHHFSTGVPRWINLICSRLLLHGMVEERECLTLDDLHQVLEGLVLEQLLPAEIKMYQSDLLLEIAQESKKKQLGGQESTTDLCPPEAESCQAEDEGADLADPVPNEHKQVKARVNAKEPLAWESQDIEADSDQADQNSQPLVDMGAKREIMRARREDVAKELFSQLEHSLQGRSAQQSLVEFLKFMHGREIGGTVLSFPLELSAMGPRGFLAWLKYTQQSMSQEAREITRMVFERMNILNQDEVA